MAKSEPQLVTPLEKLEQLEPFEGCPVIGVGIELPDAGGGLRDSLTIDPKVFHKGERIYLVVEAQVGKIRFDPIKDAGDAVRRVHVGAVKGVALTTKEAVDKLLEDERVRIEEARGLQRLPFDDEDTEEQAELREEHDQGEHAEGLVAGCPPCDEEAALEAEETQTALERRDELADRRQAKANATDDE